jgi:hypothetical protein
MEIPDIFAKYLTLYLVRLLKNIHLFSTTNVALEIRCQYGIYFQTSRLKTM